MSLKSNGAVKKYLEKWAGVLKLKSDTNLPELSDTHSFSPNHVANISSVKKLRNHKYQIRKSCMLSPSVSRKRRCFSPESLCKRLSFEQTNLNKRRDLINNCIKKSVDNHLQMITKAKRIVDDAKASRFKGFFSPRLLRNKIKDFTVSKDNRILKNDFTTKDEIREYMQNIMPKEDMERLLNKVCRQKLNKPNIRNRSSIKTKEGDFCIKISNVDNLSDKPCNILQ